MNIRPIRTDVDHQAALREIEALWGAAKGSAGADRFDVLATSPIVDRAPYGFAPHPARMNPPPSTRASGSREA
jgi:antitoxin component HigA of HigAB toxin-antitoxin module